eukprot:g7887.t1
MKDFAVIVPTHKGDLEDAILALEAWPKENVYPKGPSVMFYKMFLDDKVIRALKGYDVFSIVEWDVVVAHPTSFEMLYKAACFSPEEFWMKGSTLAGSEFHDTAGVSEMWHILGHLNGNAIYNNMDPGFQEFVNFTLNRWQYEYPYDVALWATIADFPYSWPLWQRYSSKFVATQLVCDYRCGSGVHGDLHCNWRGLGRNCRFCFQDSFDAHLADEISKTNGSRVIMCDTHEPPIAIGSNPKLELGSVGKAEPPVALRSGDATETAEVDVSYTALTEPQPEVDFAATIFRGNITRGEMCAFMVGYFEFLEETTVGVSSVLHFMPGMRVGIATHPTDYDVFNRFGCTYNTALSQKGYDLGKRMAQEFESFKLGLGKCEMGFRDVDPSELDIKTHQEFGVNGELQDMPDLRDLHVSVMYRSFSDDAQLFNMSVQSVIEHFPSAHEVVVVVVEDDEALFKQILDEHRASAPFPLHLVTEPDMMDDHVQQKYSKLRADLYTEGDFVLHLDSDGVVFEDIAYEHIFHLGKPVLPFRRYRNETTEGLQTILCWQNGTSFAVGEEVLHEFSLFPNHVYPRSL